MVTSLSIRNWHLFLYKNEQQTITPTTNSFHTNFNDRRLKDNTAINIIAHQLDKFDGISRMTS